MGFERDLLGLAVHMDSVKEMFSIIEDGKMIYQCKYLGKAIYQCKIYGHKIAPKTCKVDILLINRFFNIFIHKY